MSESELMREMFRLEKTLQEGGPATASSTKQPGDGLRERIQEAVSEAEETCRTSESRIECAQAWDDVSDLLSTRDRWSEPGAALRPTSPLSSSSPPAQAAPRPIPRNEDPLRGVRPADVAPHMPAPTGSLLAAGFLERLSQLPSSEVMAKPGDEQAQERREQQQQPSPPPPAQASGQLKPIQRGPDGTLPQRVEEAKHKVEEAVFHAAEVCDTPSPSQTEDCAIAWDTVEELSSALEHTKKKSMDR